MQPRQTGETSRPVEPSFTYSMRAPDLGGPGDDALPGRQGNLPGGGPGRPAGRQQHRPTGIMACDRVAGEIGPDGQAPGLVGPQARRPGQRPVTGDPAAGLGVPQADQITAETQHGPRISPLPGDVDGGGIPG